MIFPLLRARVKQGDEAAGFGVDTCEVRSLMKVAVVAGERQIREVVAAAMLPSYDVFDVECGERRGGLRQTAIFAMVSSPLANAASDVCVNHCAIIAPFALREACGPLPEEC